MNQLFDTDKSFPAWLTLSWAWEQSMDDPGEVKTVIARNLRRLREQRGLTQKSLAALLRASLGTLKAIESAAAFPDIALISDLARILEVPCTALVDPACEAKTLPRDASRPAWRAGLELRSALASSNPNSVASSASR